MRNTLKLWMRTIMLNAWVALSFALAFAHGGEDHGEKKATSTVIPAGYYSAEAISDKYEVLIKYASLEQGKAAELTLFLANALTNLPISGAQLKFSNPDDAAQTFLVTQTDSGIYAIHTQFSNGSKPAKLQVNIDGALGPDLIEVSEIAFGSEKHSVAIAENVSSWLQLKSILAIVLALILGLIVGMLLRRKPKAARIATIVLLILVFSGKPFSNDTMAHGDEDHSKTPETHGAASYTNEFVALKETQFLFEIQTGKLNQNAFSSSLQLVGTIVPTASGAAVVQSPQTGILKSLNVTVGQDVRKGQLLAMVEQTVDANTQVGWITQRNGLEAEVEAAKKNLDRLNSIKDIVAAKDIDEAKRRYDTATSNLEAFLKLLNKTGGRLTSLFAPIDGKVERFNFSIGSTVNAGQDIFQITNLAKVYVEAQVYQANFDAVKAGSGFMATTKGDSPKSIPAKLVTMGQRIDATNQSQKALFEVDNAEGIFRLGEFVSLQVMQEEGKSSLAIPNAALVELNGKPAVFTKSSAEQFMIRYLTIGEAGNASTVVLGGIESGEKIVTSGAYQLKMMYQNQ
jgi:cobalt-zinc-cadmium efflux system membrane fusion protein